jgi:hypothetical protein
MSPVAEKLNWISSRGAKLDTKALALAVPDDRIEQLVQQRAEEIVEERTSRIIKTANRIMELIYEDVKCSLDKLAKELDSVWTCARPLDFTYHVYCVTKDIKGEVSLNIVIIENALREKYPAVSIEINETLVGNEEIIPSMYQMVYPKSKINA